MSGDWLPSRKRTRGFNTRTPVKGLPLMSPISIATSLRLTSAWFTRIASSLAAHSVRFTT